MPTRSTAPQSPISVAKLSDILKVSPATVSRVLNNRPGIGEATRQRVLEAARIYGTPKLKKRKSEAAPTAKGVKMIGFLVSRQIRAHLETGNDFYARHLMGVQAAAMQWGYYSTLINADPMEENLEPSSLPGIDEGHLAGLVAEKIPEATLRCLSQRLPLVGLNSPFYIDRVDSVIPDVRHAARLHLQHLYDLGHRRIAHFGGTANWQNNIYWNEFDSFSKELGLNLPERYLGKFKFGPHEHVPVIRSFLDQLFREKEPPTALITYDTYAVPIREECMKRGIAIPGDLSIIGYDDSLPENLYSTFPLSSYRQNFEAMGREAVRLLIDRMENPDLAARRVAIAGKLVIRGSTCPPRRV